MIRLEIYTKNKQNEIEEFFIECFTSLGWGYEPYGRHSDILNIDKTYMKNGCMWCLYEDEKLAGTIAIKTIDEIKKSAELKRLYILPAYQGKGYGKLLMDTALSFCRKKEFKKVFLDTRTDRDAMIHLIKKYGFKKIERYNDNKYAELFFEMDL